MIAKSMVDCQSTPYILFCILASITRFFCSECLGLFTITISIRLGITTVASQLSQHLPSLIGSALFPSLQPYQVVGIGSLQIEHISCFFGILFNLSLICILQLYQIVERSQAYISLWER